MAIPESVRLNILRLKADGMSIREIAAETGVGKNTVERVIKKGGTVPVFLAAVPKNDDLHEGSQHTQLSPKVSPKTGTGMGTPESPPEQTPQYREMPVSEVRTITRDLSIAELYDLLIEAKSTLARAKQPDEKGHHNTKAEVAAINAIRQILTQMGEWCGLDDSIKVVDVKPDREPEEFSYEEALQLAERLCRMS